MITDDLNLSVLNDFISFDKMNEIRGSVEGEIDILGTVGDPIPMGNIELNSGSFSIPQSEIVVSEISSGLRIEPGRIVMDSLIMNSGEGFMITKGEVSLDGIIPNELNMTMKAEDFRLSETNRLDLVVDADATITGNIDQPLIAGNVAVNEGFYFAPEFGDRDIENVELEGDEDIQMNPIYSALSLNINVTFDEEFALKNELYLTQEIKNLQGELTLTKQSGRPLLANGSVWSEDGFARPLGKLFNLEEARYTFVGNPDNPEVFSVFAYQPPQTRRRSEQEINIFYLIEGTLDSLQYVFESEPELDQRDIIGYVLFGKPYYSLNSVQQGLTSVGEDGNVDDVTLNLLVTQVEALATQQFGVDLVEVSSIRQGTSRGTAIQTGWYVNDRTFFRIINEIGSNPKILFVLEYLVNQNLDLIITQGNDRRQGVDLQWIFDY